MENDSSSHDSSMPPTAPEARAALAGLRSDGASLAERFVTPAWYHPVLGAIVAAFVGAQAVPGPLSMIVLALGAVGLVGLVVAYRRRYGILATQPAGPRSKRAIAVVVVVLMALMIGSVVIKFAGLPLWWVFVPAAIAFVATVVLGRRYDAVLRSELAESGGRA